jgi:hypothetical protein
MGCQLIHMNSGFGGGGPLVVLETTKGEGEINGRSPPHQA